MNPKIRMIQNARGGEGGEEMVGLKQGRKASPQTVLSPQALSQGRMGSTYPRSKVGSAPWLCGHLSLGLRLVLEPKHPACSLPLVWHRGISALALPGKLSEVKPLAVCGSGSVTYSRMSTVSQGIRGHSPSFHFLG